MEATGKPPSDLGALFAESTDIMQNGRLFQTEIFWRDHRSWLEDCGYVLRRRFQPDWVASWLNPPRLWITQEDAVVAPYAHLIDAVRRSDGVQVMLKRINCLNHPDEIKIGQLFSSEPLVSDRRNHCVPIYDVLKVPEDADMAILVMPVLVGIEEIPFDTIGEAVEFFRQIFEGLQFMHQRHISHRDPKYNNILMDAIPLYREPPHPLNLAMNRDFSRRSKARWSRTRKPVKYYFIDFGLSKQYPSDDQVHLEPPGWAGDKSVPEFRRSDNVLCDPFAVDVYCVGNLIRCYFLEGFMDHPGKKGFEFMTELVVDMVKDNPAERPKMDEVVERYAILMSGLSDHKLRSRIIEKEEKPLEGKLRSIMHNFRQIVRRLLWVPAIPTP